MENDDIRKRIEAEIAKTLNSIEEYKDLTKPIAPDVLKAVHAKIMVPLFMSGKNNVMAYATPEQWESISQGGALYKAATQLGRQTWTAGQNRPKTALV